MQEDFEIPAYDSIVIKNLEEKKAAKCPSCGSIHIATYKMALLPRVEPGELARQVYYYLIPVQCRNCGHVRLFTPKAVGVEVQPRRLEDDF